MGTLSIEEQKVLDIINSDPGGWFYCYHPDIMSVCDNDFVLSESVCRSLRKKKLVDSQGRGKFACYGKKL